MHPLPRGEVLADVGNTSVRELRGGDVLWRRGFKLHFVPSGKLLHQRRRYGLLRLLCGLVLADSIDFVRGVRGGDLLVDRREGHSL